MSRTYGSGSFKQRTWSTKDGKTKTSWSGYVYADDGKQCYGSGNTQKAAERAAQGAREAYEFAQSQPQPEPAPLPMPTLSEWTEQYNALKALNNRLKSNQKYRELRRKAIEHRLPDKTMLGDRPLDAITLSDLESYQATIRKKYAPNSAYMIVAYVRAVLQSAVDHEKINRNRAILLQKIKRKTKNTLTLDDDGFALLMARADDRMRAALVLGYHGLRASEAMGLTLDCIDGNRIRVRQQLARIDNPNSDGDKTIVALTSLKTDAGSRTITVNDDVMRVLMAALDHAKPAMVYDATANEYVERTFVVPNNLGGPWHVNGYQRMFRLLAQKAGVSAHHHDLRAMCVTDSIDASTPTKIVSAMVGHSATTVTEGWYNRIRREQLAPVTLARSERATRAMGKT